ncbi:MAG: hypothetical protein ACI9GJ_000922, partial [Parasphingorhabdus sp.]
NARKSMAISNRNPVNNACQKSLLNSSEGLVLEVE